MKWTRFIQTEEGFLCVFTTPGDIAKCNKTCVIITRVHLWQTGTGGFTAFCTHDLDECLDLHLEDGSHSSLRMRVTTCRFPGLRAATRLPRLSRRCSINLAHVRRIGDPLRTDFRQINRLCSISHESIFRADGPIWGVSGGVKRSGLDLGEVSSASWSNHHEFYSCWSEKAPQGTLTTFHAAIKQHSDNLWITAYYCEIIIFF